MEVFGLYQQMIVAGISVEIALVDALYGASRFDEKIQTHSQNEKRGCPKSILDGLFVYTGVVFGSEKSSNFHS